MMGLSSSTSPRAATVHVVHTVPALFTKDDGVIGGGERYALELARHMADAVATSLVTFGERAREERIGNLRITVLGNPWYVRGQRTNPVALGLLGHLRKADVVHCHQQHLLSSTIAAVTARALGRRVFCTELGGGGWDVSAYISTDRLYHEHLHISEYSRTIAGHGRKPWARVILGGVDPSAFSPSPVAPPDGPVLFVGRLLPHKGVDMLIRGLPAGLRAEIVGPAPDARYLADLKSLAAGKAVTFRHDCGHDELVDAYRRARCVVLPSVYRDMYGGETKVPELLGQTLLEGMVCGRPAVCTNVGSLPEVVDNGVTGLVVPPSDPAALDAALGWMSDHPSQARAMGDAGRARALERFQWPAVVQRCFDAYVGERPASIARTTDRSEAGGTASRPIAS